MGKKRKRRTCFPRNESKNISGNSKVELNILASKDGFQFPQSKKGDIDVAGRNNSTPNAKSRNKGKKRKCSPIRISENSKIKQKPTSAWKGQYPYPTDYNDHFETPARAYLDILPLIDFLLTEKRNCCLSHKDNTSKPRNSSVQSENASNEFVLYDPYYCTGRAANLLRDTVERNNLNAKIKVQHEMRDFYKDISEQTVPYYDVLITNPPYSSNHKEKCLQFAVEELKTHGRPFFLLMPNYVATKDYFQKIVGAVKKGNIHDENSKTIQTVYVFPSSSRPYEYDHPEGTGHKISPFASVWFIGLRYHSGVKKFGEDDAVSYLKSMKNAFERFHSQSGSRLCNSGSMPQIAITFQHLIQMGAVSGERRKNPRQRKKMRQALQKVNGFGNPVLNSEEPSLRTGDVDSDKKNVLVTQKKKKRNKNCSASETPKKKRRY